VAAPLEEAFQPMLESVPPAEDDPGDSIKAMADGRSRQGAVRNRGPDLPNRAISVSPGLP